MTQVNTDQWITLNEASILTGRSMDTLRTMIRRGKLTQVRKVRGKRGDEWVIHREAVLDPGQADQAGQMRQDNAGQVITLPVEYYAQQQKEHEQALTGLMMYRYKFEEAEKQLRLLPAPPEAVSSILEEKDQVLQRKDHELEEKAAALAQAEKILEEAKTTQAQYAAAMEQLKAKLQEEEHAREAYRLQWEAAQAELRRPWWQKLFKR